QGLWGQEEESKCQQTWQKEHRECGECGLTIRIVTKQLAVMFVKCGSTSNVKNYLKDEEAEGVLMWYCSHCRRGCAKLHNYIKLNNNRATGSATEVKQEDNTGNQSLSPNSDESNHTNLLQIMQEVNDKNVLYKIIVGDFNLPQINWSNYTSVMGLNDVGTMFIEKIRGCFLTQHIEEITRIRGDSTGLLFSNEESIVGDIKLESPLGKSDHACIYFHCDIQEMGDKSKKQVYMYEKADYLLKKQRLTMEWIQYLSLEPDIESKWNKFKRKFQAVIDECVPKKIIRGLRRLWEKLKIMKTKFNERACTREMYLETEKEYKRLNNQVRWETRNILKCKEQEIAKICKANPKVFWKYVQTKTRTKARIADLYKDEEKVQKTVNDQEKADLIRVLDRWTEIIDDSQAVSIVYCDFMKALHRVPHKRLFEKEDLDGIRGWTEKWMLNFHPEKSKYMRIGRTKVADHGYHMYTTIKKTTVEKNIGVVIDDKLTFSDHLAEKINKAAKIMREDDTTRGNTKKIYKTRARLNLRRHSFPSRVVNNWNGLPEWVVNVETVEKFEAKLDKYWKNQEQVYNYRA
ncbi:putative Endonuclease-reverse transcriptase-containing protein 9, partial [Homarus americanus]